MRKTEIIQNYVRDTKTGLLWDLTIKSHILILVPQEFYSYFPM